MAEYAGGFRDQLESAAVADTFLKKVTRSNGKLHHIRGKLQPINKDDDRDQLNIKAIGRSHYHNMAVTYKLYMASPEDKAAFGDAIIPAKAWVIKFGIDPSWHNVKAEFRALTALSSHDVNFPVPKPIYESTDKDEKILNGVPFIIMSFVRGHSFQCIQDIPDQRYWKVALKSVVAAAARLHEVLWGLGKLGGPVSEDFWPNHVKMWVNNCGGSPMGLQPVENELAQQLQPEITKARKTKVGSIIHGSLDISNVIFDLNYEVKAIVDWKYATIGDPNVDLAYLFTMFLDPPRGCRPRKILIDGAKPSENVLVDHYRSYRHQGFKFYRANFKYARAVCCMRLISILMCSGDEEPHECRQYIAQNQVEGLIGYLTAQGLEFLAN